MDVELIEVGQNFGTHAWQTKNVHQTRQLKFGLSLKF